jgi:CBS domain-containing protein
MRVRDVMTRGVECAWSDESIAVAAKKMQRLNVGSLPVRGTSGGLVGMVTDRDITVRAIAEASDPTNTAVRDVMTPHVTYCRDDQKLDEAAHLMEQNQVRRLVVLDSTRQVVGIVSLGDLAVKSPDEQLSGAALEAVSFPAAPIRHREDGMAAVPRLIHP